MTVSVNPNQKQRSAASDLGLHCLHRPVCFNIYDHYGEYDIAIVDAADSPATAADVDQLFF